MTTQATKGTKFASKRKYPNIEVALFGSDGAEFAGWANEVINEYDSPMEAARIILKAVMPVTFPFLGMEESDRLVADWFSGAKTITKSEVRAMVFGLCCGMRLGKLTVAQGILSGQTTNVIDSQDVLSDKFGLDDLVGILFSRPAGYEASLGPLDARDHAVAVEARTSGPAADEEFIKLLDNAAAEALDEKSSRQRKRKQLAELVGGLLAAAKAAKAGKGAGPACAPPAGASVLLNAIIGKGTPEEVTDALLKGGFTQDKDGMWYRPQPAEASLGADTNGDNTVADSGDEWTQREGGGPKEADAAFPVQANQD